MVLPLICSQENLNRKYESKNGLKEASLNFLRVKETKAACSGASQAKQNNTPRTGLPAAAPEAALIKCSRIRGLDSDSHTVPNGGSQSPTHGKMGLPASTLMTSF